ncbi:FMP21-like protein [Emericellopsis atlantica]|uniref:Succinate dehydrogenase assembly factor 4, mitochondrial n=1 Tax=Emericellopsis atlantica TaxID=2614577 RepID=A0A9P7ZS17_9HYPO|nr:FMP21-like protein [Emericellopsis atlantica]KAG9256593.1 FMP21-like protein [Emericellopsis atlantica]
MTRQLLQRAFPRLALPTRAISIRTYASSFRPGPAPPKLPAEQQAEFERLQRQAAVSSAFNPPTSADAASPESKTSETAAAAKGGEEEEEALNQGLFRGAKPEFRGDVNPKTGEVGGPKNDPLRWGSSGEWTYNGRATDF